MASNDFELVEQLFNAAAERSPAERDELLAEVRRDQPEVYRKVQRLLDNLDRGSDLPEVDLQPGGEPQLDEAERRWGHYRLLRRVGAGGMGAVWQAEQTEPIQRIVAIKVVPGGRDSRRVIERFELERQVLAGMSHPNIAQVFEADETPDGRPYFAMEFVEGDAITRFCDRQEYDLRRRIELMIEVCDGVTHAHQRGVIHRDLKPSNILVSQPDPDTRPIPKIIDFGISKATSGALGARTRLGEVIGTPKYMSPEQGAGDASVDVRSDVWSLGVILHELLSGVPPKAPAAKPSDVRSSGGLIGSADPDRSAAPPSDSLERSVTPGQVTEIARRRRTSPRQLERSLRGDLHWIVERATAELRGDRYASVADLAADLQRYLESRPVTAAPQSAGYRARRFYQRNRALSIAAALLVAAVAAAVIGTGTGMLRARSAERLAVDAQERAERDAELAERSKNFLVDLFKAQHPIIAEGRELTVAEVFDSARDQVQEELVDQPALQAELLMTLGSVYNEIADYDTARDLLEQAVQIYRDLGVEREADLGRAQVDLGKMLWRVGDHEASVQVLREAAARIQEHEGRTLRLASALNALSNSVSPDDPDEALAILGQSLEVLEEISDNRALDLDDRAKARGQVGLVLANLATSNARLGRWDDALALFDRARPAIEREHGENDPRLGTLIGNQAFVLRKLGQFERAYALQLDDLERTRKVLGDDHPDVGTVLLNLSQAETRLGHWDEAVRSSREAVRILAAKVPAEHPNLARARGQVGYSLSQAGRADEAREVLQDLEQLARNHQTPREYRHWLRVCVNLAEAERRAGRWQVALRRARDAAEKSEGNDALIPERADALFTVAGALAGAGDVDEARTALEAASDFARDRANAPDARLHLYRAVVLGQMGAVEEALTELEAWQASGGSDAVVETEPALEEVRRTERFGRLMA